MFSGDHHQQKEMRYRSIMMYLILLSSWRLNNADFFFLQRGTGSTCDGEFHVEIFTAGLRPGFHTRRLLASLQRLSQER